MDAKTALSLLVVAAGGLGLFWGGAEIGWTRSMQEGWNLGHVALFWAVGGLMLKWGRIREKSFTHRAVLILGAAVVLGLAVEVIQAGLGRTADLVDMERNLVGSLAALAFASPEGGGAGSLGRYWLRRVAVIALLMVLIPLVLVLTDEALARRNFPLLADFENPLETGRWTGDADFRRVPRMASRGRFSMEVSLGTEAYSGVFLEHFPGDWRGSGVLRMEVFNSSPRALQFVCRIHDRQHEGAQKQAYEDRYNESFILAPGWNSLEISLKEVERAPKGRRMDMGRIRGVGFFTIRLPSPATVYMDNLRLAR